MDPETRGLPDPPMGPFIDVPRFSALPDFKTKRTPAFASSLLGHALVIAAMFFLSGPFKDELDKPVAQNYSVHYLELQVPRMPRLIAGGGGGTAPAAPGEGEPKRTVEAPKTGAAGTAPAPQKAPTPHRKFELPNVPQPRKVEQTLVQLELPPELTPRADIRVPAVLLWESRNLPRPPARKFIAPARKQVAKVQPNLPTEPKLDLPNQERNISNLNFSAVRVTEVPLLPQPTSSTTPIRVVDAGPTTPIPQSAAANSEHPEPANVISIPDMPLPGGKVLTIPPVNQVASAHVYGGGIEGNGADGASGNAAAGAGTATGKGTGATGSGAGAGAGVATGSGTGTGGAGSGAGGGSGNGGAALGGAGTGAGTGTGSGIGRGGSGSGGGSGLGTGPGSGSGTGAGVGGTGSVTRITRAQDGKFQAVVLGSADTAQAYPESAGVLTSRLVYTVYLKVGMKKSWIMQYCLPKSAEQAAKAKGSATPVEPPFPFLILRPNLRFDSEMDYLIVHGVVTSTGKFEQLTIIGATNYPQERLLLSSLGLWEFRPASKDGQATVVEVLLIIPREEV